MCELISLSYDEVFKNVFIKNNNETFVCLIGDPKQMIYAWRKADMGTYIAAKADMDLINGDQAVYFMKENFRSSYKYIDAMNLFYKALEYKDAVLYNDFEDAVNKSGLDFSKMTMAPSGFTPEGAQAMVKDITVRAAGLISPEKGKLVDNYFKRQEQ